MAHSTGHLHLKTLSKKKLTSHLNKAKSHLIQPVGTTWHSLRWPLLSPLMGLVAASIENSNPTLPIDSSTSPRQFQDQHQYNMAFNYPNITNQLVVPPAYPSLVMSLLGSASKPDHTAYKHKHDYINAKLWFNIHTTSSTHGRYSYCSYAITTNIFI